MIYGHNIEYIHTPYKYASLIYREEIYMIEYAYECRTCHYTWDDVAHMDDPVPPCPECNSEDTYRQICCYYGQDFIAGMKELIADIKQGNYTLRNTH